MSIADTRDSLPSFFATHRNLASGYCLLHAGAMRVDCECQVVSQGCHRMTTRNYPAGGPSAHLICAITAATAPGLPNTCEGHRTTRCRENLSFMSGGTAAAPPPPSPRCCSCTASVDAASDFSSTNALSLRSSCQFCLRGRSDTCSSNASYLLRDWCAGLPTAPPGSRYAATQAMQVSLPGTHAARAWAATPRAHKCEAHVQT
jgi:hypothetical protein